MNQLNLFWETWIDVVDYEGIYKVNGIGDVMNSRTGKILKQKKSNGYFIVYLHKNGKEKGFMAHRLVYEAFYEKIPFGMEIDHIDTIRDNNTVENLRCVTRKDNCNNPITKKRHDEAMNKLSKDPEWLRKTTEAARKRAQDPEWLKKHVEVTNKIRNKPVNQYTIDGEFLKTWPSAKEVERELGYYQRNISACCLGKQKTAYGSIWKFKQNDQA